MKNFNPNKKQNLTAVELIELVDSNRIIYLTAYKSENKSYKKELRKVGKDLTFFVDKKTNLAIPLKMQLYTNRDLTLIPNQPVCALTYEGTIERQIQFDNLGIEFPFGYYFWNKRMPPAGDVPYFSKSESGWKSEKQGITLEALTKFSFNRESKKSLCTVEYSL